jgi:hypothetical protein
LIEQWRKEYHNQDFSLKRGAKAIEVAGDSGTISNFLRPDLIPRLRELLKKSRA